MTKLSNNEFQSNEIDDPVVFLQIHDGQTLIERIAEMPNRIDLIEETLHRFGSLMKEVLVGLSYQDILYQYLLFFCEIIAASPDHSKTDYILHKLPEIYQLYVANQTHPSISKLSPHYVDFLPQTQSNIPYADESPLIYRLRHLCLSIDIGSSIKNCFSLDKIDISSLKKKLKDMSNQALYGAPPQENTYQTQLSTISKKLSEYTGITLPMSQTHTQYQLSCYADILSLINEISCKALSTAQKLSKIELLYILYREGNEDLQTSIASHIDKMVQSNADDTLLLKMLLITITPAPLGRALLKFRENGPALLSHLHKDTIQCLLNTVPLLLSSDEERKRYQNRLAFIQSLNQPSEITLDYKDGTFSNVFPELTDSSLWLAHILSLSNTPHDIIIRSLGKESNDRRIMLSMMGSDKLILVYNANADAGTIITDYHFYEIFSPREAQFRININDQSFFYLPRNLMSKSLQHGIRTIRIHHLRYHSNLYCFDEHKNHLGNEPLYLQFSKSSHPRCDIILSKESIMPGELSLASRQAMSYCADILATYGNEVISVEHDKTNLKLFQRSPMLCAEDYMPAFIEMIQHSLLKTEEANPFVWVICKNKERNQDLKNHFVYDLYIFKDHIKKGPFSQLNIGNIDKAPAQVKSDYPSLFVVAYVAARKAWLDPSEKLMSSMPDEIHELNQFGIRKADNPFRK